MLKLEFQYFGHLMQRAYSMEKPLTLGMVNGKRRRGQQRIRWLDSIIDSMDMNLSKLWEIVIPEWSSSFPYFLQFESEFGNKEFMI